MAPSPSKSRSRHTRERAGFIVEKAEVKALRRIENHSANPMPERPNHCVVWLGRGNDVLMLNYAKDVHFVGEQRI